ncbi:MAG: hypothetical protein K9G30_08320 [Parvibaculum sp.]|nr:hypothetical protein [Parvibaculum sp.]
MSRSLSTVPSAIVNPAPALKHAGRETIIRELTLEDMLSDPLTHLVMRRDGVSASEIRSLAQQAAKRAA